MQTMQTMLITLTMFTHAVLPLTVTDPMFSSFFPTKNFGISNKCLSAGSVCPPGAPTT